MKVSRLALEPIQRQHFSKFWAISESAPFRWIGSARGILFGNSFALSWLSTGNGPYFAYSASSKRIFGVITSSPMEMPHLCLGAGGIWLRKEKTPENRVLEGFANWRPHGDSNPGYCRERAVS